MSRRTIKITAIVLAIIATLSALMGFDFVSGQKLPPPYQNSTLDV